jgi:hypothetical protein
VRLLLDAHIKKAAVPALEQRCPAIDVVHIANWHGGVLRTAEDEEILITCSDERRVLVSYDQRTIPDLLRRWAAEDRSHAGVIFGDSDSVPAWDPGAVAAGLSVLIQELSGSDLTNVVRYLRRRS